MVSERPNEIGMSTAVPKPAVGPLQAAPPEIKRELFEAAPPPPHRHALGQARLNAFHDGDDTILDGIDGAVVEAAQAAEAQVQAEVAGEQLKGMVRVRGGGCAASTPRGGFPLEPSSSPTRPHALDDGDHTNLNVINDGDNTTPLPPKLRRALAELDKIVIQVLMCGAIRLLRVEWLMKQPANFRMPNRQALEVLEESGASPSPLLGLYEAAGLVERGDRSIGTLTYGWLSPGDPDPDGSRIRVLRRALKGIAIRIEALFWDFGSLYQNPRSPRQEEAFVTALKGGAMNQLYASILATTVLQIEEIPPRPAEFDGIVCLFKLSANVDENKVRTSLVGFGTIESCDLKRTPPIVRFASHASAVAAKNAGAWPGICEGLDTLYNETPYFSRGW
jgi:hypothetical protein